MIDRRIVKFKLRRGTDDQRKTVVFEEGEMIYTTDTKRVYVGDGRLSGGHLLNNSISNLSSMPAAYTPNDLIYRTDLGLLYTVTDDPIDPFTFTGPYADNTTITFNANKLTLALSGVAPQHLSTTVAGSGLGLNLSGLFVNFNPARMAIEDGRLTVLPNALSGVVVVPGGGLQDTINGLRITVDNATLGISNQINGNDIHVLQVSAQHIAPGSINIAKLSADVVAPLSGLKYTSSGLAVDYDVATMRLVGGKISVDNTIYTNQTGLTGFQLLQNGFTIQWGVLSGVLLNETFTTVTFPTTFTQCYNVQATLSLPAATIGSITPIVKNITASTVSIGSDLGFNTVPVNGTIYWTALGYKL